MKLLLVGGLSWHPERVRSLCERGHRLWGLWSRSMAWDQGPYPATDGCVQTVAPGDAAATIREQGIDCVYSLYQVYDRRLWGAPAPGVEHDVWTLLRRLLEERGRGAFDVPIVRHWGFDVKNLDPEVVEALDGHVFCNREKRDYWTLPRAEGGRGLDVFGDSAAHAFADGDLPKLEFMNDRFAAPLSESDGEIHTVCAGRPFNIDFVAAARRGIHVHLYSNDVDDAHRTIAGSLPVMAARREASLLNEYLHVHPSLQPKGTSWPEVRDTKSRWVEEFSRYDAAWSYIGTPLRWDPLDERATVPNRLGTHLLAGLPIITDRRPGFDRYERLCRLGVQLELVDGDYDSLRAQLATEVATRERRERARTARAGFSFESTIDTLLTAFEDARERYHAEPHASRTRFEPGRAGRLVHLGPLHRRVRSVWEQRRRLLAPVTSRAIARTLTSRR